MWGERAPRSGLQCCWSRRQGALGHKSSLFAASLDSIKGAFGSSLLYPSTEVHFFLSSIVCFLVISQKNCLLSCWRNAQACTYSSPNSGPLREDAPAWCLAPFEPEGFLRYVED